MAQKNMSLNDLKIVALEMFAREFGEKATLCVYAPGRINLIGEHTDYNEGFVLPMALPMVTVIAGKPNNRKRCTVVSASSAVTTSKAEFDLSCREVIKPGEPKWANYIKGAIANFHLLSPGFDAVVVSTVPVGAGLSSSAALEVATYTFLEALTGSNSVNPCDKALACQKAEHDFAGVPCGIMDQFISAMGQEGHALLLDCRDLTTVQIPVKMDNNVFLITNSNAPHKLSSSAYSERRDACYEAAKKLSKKSLRDATMEDLAVLQAGSSSSETLIKRARHVISEIERTQSAADALRSGDFAKFGELMNQSHDSLRNDYEVSSSELDTLVATAREVDGVLGSRLTGAGFGGCTVTLVREDAVDPLIQRIKEKYPGTPNFYIAKPANGARRLEIDV